MHILINPHFFSNLVLFFAGAYIFQRFIRFQILNMRILWGIFIGFISAGALTDALALIGPDWLKAWHQLINTAEMSIGYLCLVSATWSIILNRDPSKLILASTISLGLLLFFCLVWFKVAYIGVIIQSMCIVIIMLISCFGLAAKQKTALWIIISMMFMALSNKSFSIGLPMDPVDIQHYLQVLSLICIGMAFKGRFKVLF